jgi:hypothetical protein
LGNGLRVLLVSDPGREGGREGGGRRGGREGGREKGWALEEICFHSSEVSRRRKWGNGVNQRGRQGQWIWSALHALKTD